MSEKVLDVEEFMARVQEDKDLLFELLDIFVQDFQGKRRDLGEAVEKEDSETIKHVAHFLKGSCGNISAKPMRAVLIRIEEKVEAGVMDAFAEDLAAIDKQFEELVAHIGELRTRL